MSVLQQYPVGFLFVGMYVAFLDRFYYWLRGAVLQQLCRTRLLGRQEGRFYLFFFGLWRVSFVIMLFYGSGKYLFARDDLFAGVGITAGIVGFLLFEPLRSFIVAKLEQLAKNERVQRWIEQRLDSENNHNSFA